MSGPGGVCTLSSRRCDRSRAPGPNLGGFGGLRLDSKLSFLDSQIRHLQVLAMSFRKWKGVQYLPCTYGMEARSDERGTVSSGIRGGRDAFQIVLQ